MAPKKFLLSLFIGSFTVTSISPMSYQTAHIIPAVASLTSMIGVGLSRWMSGEEVTSTKGLLWVGGTGLACWAITRFVCWIYTPAQLLKRAKYTFENSKQNYSWLFSKFQSSDSDDIADKQLLDVIHRKYCGNELSLISAARDLSVLKNDLDKCIEWLNKVIHMVDAESEVIAETKKILAQKRGPLFYQRIVENGLIVLKEDPRYLQQLELIEQQRRASAAQSAAAAQQKMAVTQTIKLLSRCTP